MFTINNPRIALSVLILAATLGASVIKADAMDGFMTKVPAREGSYCHMQFPAIRPSTLGSERPQLKSSQTGDRIDYYGACDHDPLSRDEVFTQRRDDERRQEND
jgi:hypothetical protein